jgi:hypothetical protein
MNSKDCACTNDIHNFKIHSKHNFPTIISTKLLAYALSGVAEIPRYKPFGATVSRCWFQSHCGMKMWRCKIYYVSEDSCKCCADKNASHMRTILLCECEECSHRGHD